MTLLSYFSKRTNGQTNWPRHLSVTTLPKIRPVLAKVKDFFFPSVIQWSRKLGPWLHDKTFSPTNCLVLLRCIVVTIFLPVLSSHHCRQWRILARHKTQRMQVQVTGFLKNNTFSPANYCRCHIENTCLFPVHIAGWTQGVPGLHKTQNLQDAGSKWLVSSRMSWFFLSTLFAFASPHLHLTTWQRLRVCASAAQLPMGPSGCSSPPTVSVSRLFRGGWLFSVLSSI